MTRTYGNLTPPLHRHALSCGSTVALGKTILPAIWRLCLATSPVLRRYVEQAVAFRRPPWLVVDLSGVTTVHDHGRAIIAEMAALVDGSSGRVLLVGFDETLSGSLTGTRLQVRQSLEEAIAELLGEGIGGRGAAPFREMTSAVRAAEAEGLALEFEGDRLGEGDGRAADGVHDQIR